MLADRSSSLLDVESLRAEFPALAREVHGRPLVYLDSAATAQKPRAVLDAVRSIDGHDCANVHRAVHALGEAATRRYEDARATMGRFLGAASAAEIVFTRGATEALNLVAQTFGRQRVGAGDEHGVFINQLQVYGLLALYLLEYRGDRGAIVKTLSTTSMLESLGRLYDVPVYETGVGFKYVGPKMVETNAMMGGEESGGFAFRGLPERDGILAGMYLMDFMVRTGKTPSQLVGMLFDKVGAHYYDRIDMTFPSSERAAIKARLDTTDPAEVAGIKVNRVNRSDGYKYELDNAGWLLIRFSGTEPLMRVYTETTRQDKVQDLLRAGVALAGVKVEA